MYVDFIRIITFSMGLELNKRITEQFDVYLTLGGLMNKIDIESRGGAGRYKNN